MTATPKNLNDINEMTRGRKEQKRIRIAQK
jgi:hypothetical protein